MQLPIVHFNEPVLRKKGVAVKDFDAALRTLSANMIDTMMAAEGIGLAAQQVGAPLQFFVMDLRPVKAEFDWEFDGRRPPLDLFMPLGLANPMVTVLPGLETTYEEGCLSFPGIRGDVVRPDAVRLEFQDIDGVPHSLVCTGLLSRCVQHEVDHLNGVLFIDRMSRKVVQKLDPALKDLKKKTREESAKGK